MMQENEAQGGAAATDRDLSRLGVTEAAEAIRKGEVSSERYTSALLRRAQMHSDLNAFITIDEAAVLEAAREADKRRTAGVTAPLLGVPIGIKDSYLTKGVSTTFGLDKFHFVPNEDADPVSEIKRVGGIVFGKNNLVAMSYGLTGKDSHSGQVKNPHNKSRVSGGSSSGAGAAVGARIVPAALGGDTVGSIRVPASLSGVVGFKPTIGRWPGRGVAPISHTLDTTGVLGRSVADCALIDQVVTRREREKNGSIASLKGMRFANAPRQYLDLVAPEVRGRFDDIVMHLRSEGAEVLDVDLGEDFASITRSATWNIFFHETMSAIQKFLLEHEVPITFDEIYHNLSSDLQDVWGQLVLPTGSGYVSSRVYETALSVQRNEIQRRISSVFNATGAEAFLLPTTPCAAPLIEQQLKFTIAGHDVDYLALANNTVSASLAGLPGISLPFGFSDEKLPIGLELDGRYGEDTRLLEVAGLVEHLIANMPVVM